MNKNILSVTLGLFIGAFAVSAQERPATVSPGLNNGKPAPSPTPKPSETYDQNLEMRQNADIPREKREEAYAKLLEGQRYFWILNRSRTRESVANAARMSKQAFQRSVELNPTLAEAYTGLAELELLVPPRDGEEAVRLANLAVKINPDSFGAHRILARIHTLQSRLNEGDLDPNYAQKAITEWKEITRLDPRSAEAWAFLSAFYERTGKSEERINALAGWLAAAAPVEVGFYRTVMGNQESLTPERAAVKLGAALVDAGRTGEAVEILSRVISDEPENIEVIELMNEALETADEKNATLALQAINQAIYGNPENAPLINLAAQIQLRFGKIDEGAKILRDAISKIEKTDRYSASNLQISLGDLYLEGERYNEAITAYQNSLRIRGIEKNELITDENRDFAIRVYDKMIRTLKSANRFGEAQTLIENSRPLFGNDDLFIERQQIDLLLENGKRQEALQAVRKARIGFPSDYSLLRLEASILTDLGKVDEGVRLIRPLIGKTSAIPSPMSDDFINYLYISGLYSQAKRGKEAIESANQAFNVAGDVERKQIAKLTLATAQQMSGDFAGAEKTLRDILAQSPGNPIALNNLGYFLLERNEKIKEALELIQRAVKIDPTNPSYLDSLGWAYFKVGNFPDAEKYLKNAARLDPTSATILDHLGDVYQKQGKTELAKSVWQKAVNLASDPDDIKRIKSKLNVK